MPALKHRDQGRSARTDNHGTHLLGVQSLVGNKLYDASGNRVGKLEEIVLDVRTGCVRHVIVATGGFLGLGERRFAVPWSALRPDADYCRTMIDVAQMRLTAVPINDDDPWLRHASTARLSNVPNVDHRALGAAD